MGKKYLDTKKGTLESSILGVWKTAAEENAVRMDGRTKGYKTHREKLEAARLRREKKNLNKEEVELDEATGKEIAAKMMKDKSMKAFASKVAKMKTVSRDDLEKMLPDYVAGAAITKLFEEVDLEEGSKEEYQKFFNAAMKKFKIDSPADLKSDEEKKKFFDYVDKNYKGEKEEELRALKSELKLHENFGVHKDIPAMEVGTDRYRDYVVGLTPGEGNPEWAKARDFKVQSMRESLIKIWEKAEKQDEDEDEKIAPVKGKKTMTGGAVAKVETKPKIDG